MSFEQPVYSFNFPGGEPPTPTRTPTSPNFFLNSFETPKPDTRFNEPFSPWTPALGTSPGLKTPTKTSFKSHSNDTFPHSEQTKSSSGDVLQTDVRSREDQIAVHNSPSLTLQTSNQDGLNGNSSQFRKQKRSPIEDTAKDEFSPPKKVVGKTSTETVKSASSMQTPPPTSTSSSRRKVEEAQLARSMQDSVSREDRTMSSPSFSQINNLSSSSMQVDESPIHFPNLQFSPDGFTLPTSGPATAPVYPQHKLFWDPEQSADAMNLDFSMDDSFTNMGLGLQRQLEPFVSEHETTNGLQLSNPTTLESGSNASISIADFSSSKHSMALNQTNISPSTAIMTQGSSRGKYAGTVVNPSLLFSSPGRSTSSSKQKIQDDALKPYAHQLQDAEIEREIRSQRPKRKRGIEVESPAVKAATHALREAEDEVSQGSSDGAVSASFGGPMRPHSRHSGRASRRSKSSIEQRGKRPSITLNIDATGRASTQTTFVDDRTQDSLKNPMDLGSDSESSSSSSAPSSPGIVYSQPSSFVAPVERRKKSKSNRFHNGSSAHSHKSSYGSTLDFTNATGLEPVGISRRSKNTRIGMDGGLQVRFNDTSSFVDGPLNPDESEAETVIDTDEDKGNAQAELKKVLLRRSGQKPSGSTSSRFYGQSQMESRPPQTRSTIPSNPFLSHMSVTPSNLSYSEVQKNISPTTITDLDLATPSTGHNSASSNGTTRCVCAGAEGDGQLMVQCESCKNWLHTRCVGLNDRNIPDVYLCIFCAGPTPNARRGRMREPSRGSFPPPSSPLAHKSFHDQ